MYKDNTHLVKSETPTVMASSIQRSRNTKHLYFLVDILKEYYAAILQKKKKESVTGDQSWPLNLAGLSSLLDGDLNKKLCSFCSQHS